MSLPPLCNLIAIWQPDPRLRREEHSLLQDSGLFQSVLQREDGWLLAAQPLPGGEPKTGHPRLYFCEGADLFGDHPPAQSWSDLAHCCAHTPAALQRFKGDFTLLHVAAAGELTLVRSVAGKVPLYFRREAERLLVATRLDYMVTFAGGTPRLDPLATALALSGYGALPNARSPLLGTHLLPSGHWLNLSSGADPTPHRYWLPRRAPHAPTRSGRQEHAQALYQGLHGTLQRELAPSGNLLWLSGGTDSSALAALIRGELQLPLSAQIFTAPDAASARRDAQYLQQLRRHYHFEHWWQQQNTPAHCVQLAHAGPKTVYPTCYFPLSALPAAQARSPIRVALSGEFADEGCGSPRLIGDWLDHARPATLLSRTASPGGLPVLRHWLGWHLRQLRGRPWLRLPATVPPVFHPTVHAEYRDYLRDRQHSFLQDRQPLRSLWFRVQQDAWRAEWWEATTTLGVRPLAPFHTRELLELYFVCHPEEGFDSQRPKALLRRAMDGHMPEFNRLRPDKGEWSGFLQGAHLPAPRPGGSLTAELLDAGWLQHHFGSRQQCQLPALDALQLCWLSNMLAAIESVSGTARVRASRANAQAPHPVSSHPVSQLLQAASP